MSISQGPRRARARLDTVSALRRKGATEVKKKNPVESQRKKKKPHRPTKTYLYLTNKLHAWGSPAQPLLYYAMTKVEDAVPLRQDEYGVHKADVRAVGWPSLTIGRANGGSQ